MRESMGRISFINSAFEKPVHGDFNILLECSFGDFNDGGDLWTPLLEYKKGQGAVLACQLEVMKYFNTVPQACVLVRNMLSYLADKTYTYATTGEVLESCVPVTRLTLAIRNETNRLQPDRKVNLVTGTQDSSTSPVVAYVYVLSAR